ncbi:MAG: hypothetical protein BJG00_000700 [Limnothrix sp. CACIAM 69d]|nr:MAG: hypothetical protein BJG00_000700 [Limnothrix sp. CACIAM 69d]
MRALFKVNCYGYTGKTRTATDDTPVSVEECGFEESAIGYRITLDGGSHIETFGLSIEIFTLRYTLLSPFFQALSEGKLWRFVKEMGISEDWRAIPADPVMTPVVKPLQRSKDFWY